MANLHEFLCKSVFLKRISKENQFYPPRKLALRKKKDLASINPMQKKQISVFGRF